MRRKAWNACRSCRSASLSQCADSEASSALAGCTISPCARTTSLTGDWASHSISRSGHLLAQGPGDGQVAQHVTQPDRRADPQRASLALAGEEPRGVGVDGVDGADELQWCVHVDELLDLAC